MEPDDPRRQRLMMDFPFDIHWRPKTAVRGTGKCLSEYYQLSTIFA
jgi:hypothetical protein